MQVGAAIIGAREVMPDLPASTISVPSISGSGISLAGTGSGSFPAGTYYFVFTWLNAAGETTASSETSVGLSSGFAGIQVSVTNGFPAGVTSMRAYMGSATGAENQFFAGTSTPWTITSTVGTPGTAPLNNTAFNPDSDGSVVSAATVYRWLRDALSRCALAAGGINDVTGLATTQAWGMYSLLNRWLCFSQAWYDGWLMSFLDNGNFYYHNSSTGISWMLAMQKVTTSNIVEVWPQPSRTSGQSTVSSAVAASDNVINLNSVTGWVLPLGLAMIGTNGVSEIISYSVLGTNQLQGCMRGFGGTIPQAWPVGTAVTELNIRLRGARMPVDYSPGASLVTLDVPYAWEEHIKEYMVGMYREAEQEFAEARSKKKDFDAYVKELSRQNRQLAGPTQVGLASREVWGGSVGGGWFIP